MDVNFNVQYEQSEINGMFQDIEQLKKDRTRLKETIDQKTEKIIKHILQHGNVLAYKDNTPHVLTVKQVEKKKFDKSSLAGDLDITTKELNLIGVAELVEENRITAEKLKEYEFFEPDQKLKARKAKKTDIELLTRSGA
ncbi:hypothetical protein J416_09384 [Gracilibacillus halophilus YIM-C55.5]|uniref:Phage protein n=1 Tax=Gracilibacillus halophilus YIM-C55.5 TaxID=1308866 RepID=N4WBR0_9BACI|nr:hypothetical protein [Gracilibacillus halophilus]ENH96699.1 hypothetical protein J416_09384 [Gracilibacillus halophilus YIM-C55.5]